MTTFDWANAWACMADAGDLQAIIEAAFVPVESNIQIADVTARAEAAEARVKVLEEALNAIIDRAPERDLKWTGMSGKDIAIFALGGEQ